MESFLLKDIDVFDDKLTIEYETTRFSAADWQLTLRRLDRAGFQRRLEEALRIEHRENRGSRVIVWPWEKRRDIPANRRITTYSTTTSVSDEYAIAELLSVASLKKKTKEKKKVCSAAQSRVRWWRRHANDLETRLDRNDHVFNTRESDNDDENVTVSEDSGDRRVSKVSSLCVFRETEPKGGTSRGNLARGRRGEREGDDDGRLASIEGGSGLAGK